LVFVEIAPMRIRIARWLLGLGLLCGLLFAPVSAPAAELPPALKQILEAPEFAQAHWGLLVLEATTGEVIYELNADQLFAPASTTKIFSVACALATLGPDYRFETPLVRRGELSAAGDLAGDLILIGQGDPTLGGRTTPDGKIALTDQDHTYANFSGKAQLTQPDPLGGLKDLARACKDAGLRRVHGDVIIDDRLFEHNLSTGSGPSKVTPVVVNDQVFDFTVTPTRVGAPAQVEWRPKSASVSVDVQVQTGPADSALQLSLRPAGTQGIVIRGSIPEKHPPAVRVLEIGDPSSFARTLLIEALRAEGIETQGSPLDGNQLARLPSWDDTLKLPRLASLKSPPFAENAKLILKVSHNLHASTLPLLVAVKHGERTLNEGLKRQQAFLREAGVDVGTISFGGGAGGARSDFVTPRATAQLLRYLSGQEIYEVFWAALPVLGRDGTLAGVVGPDSPIFGLVQAKTGTLVWHDGLNNRSLLTSKALAGYLTSSRGRRLVFALYVNNVPLRDGLDSGAVGRTLARVCEVIHREN